MSPGKTSVRGEIVQTHRRGDKLLTVQFTGAAAVDSDHRGRMD